MTESWTVQDLIDMLNVEIQENPEVANYCCQVRNRHDKFSSDLGFIRDDEEFVLKINS